MSNCNCGSNDQTPKASIEALKGKGDPKEVLGIAMFLVPAPELGIMEYREIIVEEPMTYSEASKRGFGCVAFKWISNSFKSLQEIQATRTPATDCFSQFCLHGSCDSWDCWCAGNSNWCR